MSIDSTSVHNARIIPILPAEELPCERVRQEQMRRQLFPAYRTACAEVSAAKRALALAQDNQQNAQTFRDWGRATLDNLSARTDLFFAKRWQHNVQQGLDHARVHAALGWAADHKPACQHAHEPMSRTRAGVVFASLAALTLTPLKTEWLPPTPEQKLDMAINGSFCLTAGSQAPGAPKAPCCNPRETMSPRRDRRPAPTTM